MRHWPIIAKANLYFWIAVLTTLVNLFQPFVENDKIPTKMMVWWISASAVLQGLLVLRAYFDSSAHRHANEIKESAKANIDATIPPTPK